MVKTSAVRIHAYGGPEEQIYETVEVGEPGPGEVGVRQTAIGVNYTDIYHRRGEIIPKGGLPFINGFEGAGVVESVGQGVTDITLGQRVAYQLAVGAYATHRLVPAGRIITLPELNSTRLSPTPLVFKTVHETFASHGSSMIWCLSRIPHYPFFRDFFKFSGGLRLGTVTARFCA